MINGQSAGECVTLNRIVRDKGGDMDTLCA